MSPTDLGFGALLDAAADILAPLDLAPAVVRITPAERSLPPITLTPADDTEDTGPEFVAALAAAAGTHARHDPDDGLHSATIGCGPTEAAVLSSPGAFAIGGEAAQPRRTTTAGHAALLRDLAAWANTLPAGVRDLEVRDTGTTYTTTLRIPDRAVLAEILAAHAVTVDPAGNASWSPQRGTGITPTGHPLNISTT
jgi:hypothetical protein